MRAKRMRDMMKLTTLKLPMTTRWMMNKTKICQRKVKNKQAKHERKNA
jgi:hypothetical protein